MVRTIRKNRRAMILLTLFIINPISSIMFGTPMPFPMPVIPEPSPGTVAILNIASLCTTLLGGIVGVAFWLDKRSKNELIKLDTKIDKNTEELKTSIKDMGKSLCTSIEQQKNDIIQGTDAKVGRAKDVVDEKFKNIEEKFKNHKERIDRLDSMSLYPKKDYQGDPMHGR